MLDRRARSALEHEPRAGGGPGARSTATPSTPARAPLIGTHDFTAFTPTDSYHQRFERDVLDADGTPQRTECSTFDITADTFMRSMNRILVGTMLEVASGLRSDRAVRASCSTAARAARPGRPRRPTASTSSSVQYPAPNTL